MIIQLEQKLNSVAKEKILASINAIGYKTTEVKTQKGIYLVCIGKNEFDIRLIGSLAGVQDVHRVSDSYKLVSRKWKVNATEIDLGDGVLIGENNFSLIIWIVCYNSQCGGFVKKLPLLLKYTQYVDNVKRSTVFVIKRYAI